MSLYEVPLSIYFWGGYGMGTILSTSICVILCWCYEQHAHEECDYKRACVF